MAGFVARTWEEYTDRLIAWIQSDPNLSQVFTDLNVGSLERSRIEAFAMALEDYDRRAQAAIAYAVPESVYKTFGFTKQAAQPAQGTVTFTAYVAPSVPLSIPAGTKVATADGVQFATTDPVEIAAGAFSVSSVRVVAVTPGVEGNVRSGGITRLLFPLPGVDVVTNPLPCFGGKAEETDAERQIRFESWINTLVRGTKEALEYATVTVSGLPLLAARAVEPFLMDPVPVGVPYAGLVWLFVDDGSGSATLESSRAAKVADALNGYQNHDGTYTPGWKAAGVHVEIKGALHRPVKLIADVIVTTAGLGRQDEIRAALTAAAQQYFAGLRIGEAVYHHKLVLALALADPDIASVYLKVKVGTGAADATDLLLDQNSATEVGTRHTFLSGVADDEAETYPKWSIS